MKTVFCLAALLMGVAVRVAVAQLVWQPGEATLLSGITLRSELSYQPEANVLLVRIANKCRAYPASQLQGFGLADMTTGCRSLFAVLDIPQEDPQEVVALIFEELVPGATVRVLQLDGHNARRVGRQYGLPATRKADWQTPQPWYISAMGQNQTAPQQPQGISQVAGVLLPGNAPRQPGLVATVTVFTTCLIDKANNRFQTNAGPNFLVSCVPWRLTRQALMQFSHR